MLKGVKKVLLIGLCFMLVFLVACSSSEETSQPYSDDLVEEIEKVENSSEDLDQTRPDYLPDSMFSRLPKFPDDFYSVRSAVRTGRIDDLGGLNKSYWMQPEFFPNFEDRGVKVLQNPPEDRFGSQGYIVYPGDSASVVEPGDSVRLYFFTRSSYLVETYQGINFEPVFPNSSSFQSKRSLPNGVRSVSQDPEEASDYFNVSISPDPFLLAPNFPVFRENGTVKVEVVIEVSESVPEGNYVIGFDTFEVPSKYEDKWEKEHLNKYVSGSMTNLNRPYHRAFVSVGDDDES